MLERQGKAVKEIRVEGGGGLGDGGKQRATCTERSTRGHEESEITPLSLSISQSAPHPTKMETATVNPAPTAELHC